MKERVQSGGNRIVRGVLGGTALLAGITLCAQPSLPPASLKAERAPDITFETKPVEPKPGNPPRSSGSSSKKSSSSSKSRSAEIRAMTFSDDAGRINRPLIIKGGNMTAKVRDQLREDLLVMCRILEKAARDHLSDHHKAAGIDLFTFGGNRSVRTMYLDEYGVVFTLNVRIPLRNEEKADEPETKEATLNEEWEETRSELFGQKRRVRRTVPAQAPAYDEGDVNELKNQLVDAMKNAANIRNLKANDWITVAVNGPGFLETEVVHIDRVGEDKPNAPRIEFSPRAEFFLTDEGQTSGESTMLLRVRKGSLDDIIKKNPIAEELAKDLEKAINVQVY